jgi:hypothetical protein
MGFKGSFERPETARPTLSAWALLEPVALWVKRGATCLPTHVEEWDVLFTGQLLFQSYETEMQYAVTLWSLMARVLHRFRTVLTGNSRLHVTRLLCAGPEQRSLWLFRGIHVEIVLLPASKTVGKGNSEASTAIWINLNLEGSMRSTQ